MTVDRPMDFEVFQNAVHEWFAEATGLETIWRDQGAPQPKYPYGSLKVISGPVTPSSLWEERRDYDEDRAAGQEIRLTTCSPCQLTVSCQAYVDQPDARHPGFDALQYLSRARAALSLESVRADNFRPKGIGVISVNPPQDLSSLIEDAIVSRANMDVVFSAALNIEEYTTWIEKVHGTSTSLGIDQLFGLNV